MKEKKFNIQSNSYSFLLSIHLILVIILITTFYSIGNAHPMNGGGAVLGDSLHGPAEGIFMMTTIPQSPESAEKTKSILKHNDCLNGIFIRTHWNKIEQSKGSYNWKDLDWIINLAHKYDLQYKIMLLPGSNTPDWVYDEGAEAFETTSPWPATSHYGQPRKIPLPWDSVYQHYFQRFLKKFSERYQKDKNFVALTLTGVNFTYGEMHLPKTPEDIVQWETYGNYQDRIQQVYEQLMDFYAQVFPKQQMVLHITMPIPGMEKNVDNIVRYGLKNHPDKLTLQNAQLTGHGRNQGMFSYKIISKYKDQAHIGFQSLNSFVSWPERVGSPQVAVYNFVNAGAEFWEIFVEDGADRMFTCKLADMISKARAMGPEAYISDLERTGQVMNLDSLDKKRQLVIKYEQAGDYDEALALLDETFRFISLDIRQKVNLLQQAGRPEDAVTFIKSIIDRKSSASYYKLLADVYNDMNNIEAAAKSLEKSYILSKNGLYLLEKGKLFAENNNKVKAVNSWKRFLKVENRTKEAYERVASHLYQFGYKQDLEVLKAEAARDGYGDITK